MMHGTVTISEKHSLLDISLIRYSQGMPNRSEGFYATQLPFGIKWLKLTYNKDSLDHVDYFNLI